VKEFHALSHGLNVCKEPGMRIEQKSTVGIDEWIMLEDAWSFAQVKATKLDENLEKL